MIHPTAIVDQRAELGADCDIGPYCIIGPEVVLGDRCRLHSHVVVDGHTVIGADNEVFPFTTIGMKTQDLKWQGGVTRTEVGDRNVFRENVTIHSATSDGEVTRVGSDNHILAYAHVAHNVMMGSRIIMSNAATLGGHVEVGDHAIVGGLAAVHQFCRIGRMSIIGGCSKVVQDVPPFMLADGNPAVTRTINKVGLERNGVAKEVQQHLRKASRLLVREKLAIPSVVKRIREELPAGLELEHLVEFLESSQRGICR